MENVWLRVSKIEIFRLIKCCQCFCLRHKYDCKNESWNHVQTTLFLNWNHCFYWIAAIWKILDLLQGEDNPDAHHIDDVMKRHLIDYISRLNNICSDDLSVLHSRTHWLMWVSPGLIFLRQFDINFFFPFTEIYSTCFGIVSFRPCSTIFFQRMSSNLIAFYVFWI